MRVLYFARIRQIAGRGEENLDVPATVTTVKAAGAEALFTMSVKAWSCETPLLVARTVKLKVPAADGVPELPRMTVGGPDAPTTVLML